MKQTHMQGKPALDLDERLKALPKPSQASRRLPLLAMAVAAACLVALAVSYRTFITAPESAATGGTSAPPPPSAADMADLAAMHAVIFEILAGLGMDAGRYALDARHAPDIAVQGTLFEVAGEVSLLNQPDRPTPYYAIIDQSGPLTSLRLLRVGGEVVLKR